MYLRVYVKYSIYQCLFLVCFGTLCERKMKRKSNQCYFLWHTLRSERDFYTKIFRVVVYCASWYFYIQLCAKLYQNFLNVFLREEI